MNRTISQKDTGLRRKIRQGKRLFRIPENKNHYSAENYKRAEKMFVKYCILEGRCTLG